MLTKYAVTTATKHRTTNYNIEAKCTHNESTSLNNVSITQFMIINK